MRLISYLIKHDETEVAFALRSKIPRSTINSICRGGGATCANGVIIEQATKGEVRCKDLVPFKP